MFAALLLIVLAQAGLVASVGAQGGAAGGDGIVDADPGPHGQGEARHPLLIKSHAGQRGAEPQIASAIPGGSPRVRTTTSSAPTARPAMPQGRPAFQPEDALVGLVLAPHL